MSPDGNPSLFSWEGWKPGWAIIWVLSAIWFGIVTTNVVELYRGWRSKKGKNKPS